MPFSLPSLFVPLIGLFLPGLFALFFFFLVEASEKD
jgi:hypothetical protein